MNFFMVDKEMERQTRHDFLFGLNNMAVLFRCPDGESMADSRSGSVAFRFAHECSSTKDFLSYLLAIHETGQIFIQHGDVVGVKINGSIFNFRFNRHGRGCWFDVWEFFTEDKSFETMEKAEYVDRLHKKNMVLDVLNGKEVGIDSIRTSDTAVCAIDQETYFPGGDRSSHVITDYFVYELKGAQIKIINPRQLPFPDIRSALMFFKYNKALNRSRKQILLFNREELYLLRDYNYLMTMAL